jgi:hypothetical protein
MMSRLEEFFNRLDRKNLILLYLSLFIGAFLIYYNVNMVLDEKIENNKIKISKLTRELKGLKSYSFKLAEYKKILNQLKKENFSLKEDLKYLNILISTSKTLHLTQKEFLNILEDILAIAINDNIRASYKIGSSYKDLLSYNIEMNGFFYAKDYKNFYSFIRSVDKIQKIKSVDTTQLQVKGDKVFFKIIISFWSLI